ncbi:MAG: hypothetical protein IJG63_02740 [Oscillospiraceae bacterium]|nr:hypothetical protein [Oscillospiraceae bacterium]
MKISKDATMEGSRSVSTEDMALINAQSKKELMPDEVFSFDMLLCDNDVDRDNERFDTSSLIVLAELFQGKTGIFDHEWSAKGQKARIFRTEVVFDESHSTVDGGDYAYLKASAYMLRTPSNAELIAEIEGGIKREVSVGCAVKRAVCSICGQDMDSPACGHVKGGVYDGRTCCAILMEPVDAYEWSFVAVPAQTNAGIMKKYRRISTAGMSLDDYISAAADEGIANSYAELKHRAELGDRYMEGLRSELVKKGLLAGMGFKKAFLEKSFAKMDEEELLGFRAAFDSKMDQLYPPVCQLAGSEKKKTAFDGGEFKI